MSRESWKVCARSPSSGIKENRGLNVRNSPSINEEYCKVPCISVVIKCRKRSVHEIENGLALLDVHLKQVHGLVDGECVDEESSEIVVARESDFADLGNILCC